MKKVNARQTVNVGTTPCNICHMSLSRVCDTVDDIYSCWVMHYFLSMTYCWWGIRDSWMGSGKIPSCVQCVLALDLLRMLLFEHHLVRHQGDCMQAMSRANSVGKRCSSAYIS